MGSSHSKKSKPSAASASTPNTNMATVRALAGSTVVAETTADKIVRVEGNAYFPPDALKMEFFKDSSYTTVCGWKGTASYKDVVGPDGKVFKDAAWYYESPKPDAKNIKGYYAFWKGVKVES